MLHKEIVVKGMVQGVYFRATTRSVAVGMGLTGAVKNLPDGHVWIVAEGPKDAMDEFISWCRIGPSGAKVTGLDITDGPLQHFKDFSILH
ncbi:acylphosphatase [Chitinophaga sp. NPDC101104]|uniref:acylphosphatase n=1 Tax=Chitinophaga sp. NPDC101104 TaxID=3390561 RepID=UPI003D04E0CB